MSTQNRIAANLRPFLLLLGPLAGGIALTGCDLGKLGASEIVAECGGMSVQEVEESGAITEECREALETLLPATQHNMNDRIVVLGTERDGDAATIYLHGVDGADTVLSVEDFQDGSFTLLDSAGGETLMGVGEPIIKTLQPEDGDVISMSLVTDYSTSMRDRDLIMMSDLYHDLVTKLPVVYEAEVSVFSSRVTFKQSFTEDEDLLRVAVSPDPLIERDQTSLYDSMGSSTDHLGSRDRPVRVLVVATDGGENSSSSWSRGALLEALEDEGVVVVMIGSLFSDVEEFKALTGDRGIYFYAADYEYILGELDTWVESLSESVAVDLEGLPEGATSVRVEVDGIEVTVDL